MLTFLLKLIQTITSITSFVSVIIGSYLQRSGKHGYGKYLVVFAISNNIAYCNYNDTSAKEILI